MGGAEGSEDVEGLAVGDGVMEEAFSCFASGELGGGILYGGGVKGG